MGQIFLKWYNNAGLKCVFSIELLLTPLIGVNKMKMIKVWYKINIVGSDAV